MSASVTGPADYMIEPSVDLSSDPITVAMLRIYRASDRPKQRAICRMIERAAVDKMSMEEAGRLFFRECGWSEAQAQAAVAKTMTAPPGSWRERLLD